jgi:hypothetical protein
LCLQEKKKKLFENQAPQVLLQQNLKSSTPVPLGLQKTLGIKHLVLLDMQEMMYDVLFSVLDVTATKKKPSKNFRNQNTLVLLGLQQKKNSLKIKHPKLCCEKPLEIKYTKSVGSAKNS